MSENKFLELAKIKKPIICGAMYPCSNPELVAAASEAGGLGIIQPMALTYVHRYDLREGINKIRTLTKNPLGFNVITEKSSKVYQKRMEEWVDIALEEGIRFFVTSLGDPEWVVRKLEAVGAVAFHTVTTKKIAKKVLDCGVRGLICVNNSAGGHAGGLSAEALFSETTGFNVPLIAAGGISTKADYRRMCDIGYAGIQMGTRFIVTKECTANVDYKNAIIKANADDIVLTERVTGVPLAVINTPYLQKTGLKAHPIAKMLLKGRKTKHIMRFLYQIKFMRKMKDTNFNAPAYHDFLQAGKSVHGIDDIKSVSEIISEITA